MKLLFLHIAAFLLIGSPALSQESADVATLDSTLSLPEIKISATRYTYSNRTVAARIASLDAKKVESTGGQSLDEVLQRASGVFVRQYGTGLATISLRGGNSSHSVITIDGMPLYDPQLGQVDLSLVPNLIIEKIAVLYGQGSSMYGANGLSGVLDIETRSFQHKPLVASVKATLGAYGQRQADLSFGFGKKNVRGVFAFRYGEEKGDFPYEDPSLFPVQTVNREGADQEFSSYFGKVDWLKSKSLSSLSAWLNRFERGVPGPITLQFRDERQWDRLFRLNFQHVRQASSRGNVSFRAGVQRMTLRYANPFLDIDDTGRTSSFFLDANYKLQSDSGSSIKLGVDNAFRSATHPSLASQANEIQTSAYVSGEKQVGPIILLPSFRLDRYGLPDKKSITAFSPNIGVNGNLPSLPALFLKAQIGKSFKTPTFNDRFWQPGGNIDLLPEIGWGYEAGALWDAPRKNRWAEWSSELTLYRRHVNDQISWVPTTNGYWSPLNIQGVLISGLESSCKVEPSFGKHVASNLEVIYHLTDARNQSDPSSASYNKPLRYTPKHLVKLILGASRSLDKWDLGIHAFTRYTSERFITEDASSSIPSYWTADVRVHASVLTRTSRLSFNVLVENIFDQDYEIIKGYVMPPRLFRIELGLEWP